MGRTTTQSSRHSSTLSHTQRLSSSIRARMTVNFAVTIGVLMLCVCSGITWYARRTTEKGADALLRGVSEQVRGDMSIEGRLRTPTELVTEEREDLFSSHLSLIVVDARGKIIAQTQHNAPSWPITGNDWRIAVLPFGANTAVIALPWRQTENALRAQAIGLLALGLIVTGAGAIGAWLVVGRTLSPIGLLSRQARAASIDGLLARLDTPSRDAEIVELVATLNDLLARQAEEANARGRFHAAASHELRTPLQALSGHLELALSRPRTAAAYQEVIEEAFRQTRRLTALTRDLLLLNRLYSAPHEAREDVDLSIVCDRALSACASLIQARSLAVDAALPPEASLITSPTHIEMLARNLIENAVKYAAVGGTVGVRIAHMTDGIALEVFNSCTPLTDWDPVKLCEPFFRPDASRNSQTGGTGLGLAICKAICDANAWRLTLSQVEAGVVARVEFGGNSDGYERDA